MFFFSVYIIQTLAVYRLSGVLSLAHIYKSRQWYIGFLIKTQVIQAHVARNNKSLSLSITQSMCALETHVRMLILRTMCITTKFLKHTYLTKKKKKVFRDRVTPTATITRLQYRYYSISCTYIVDENRIKHTIFTLLSSSERERDIKVN